MLQNPFLVIRYACFCLILFLNLITLIFAAWNVAVMKSSEQAVPGASVLILFNGGAIFLSVLIALAELVVVKAKTAKVRFECTWTALMAFLQLAAAVAITSTGPPILCQPKVNMEACTSVTVLVPVVWLSAFTVIAYFLTLTITAIVSAPSYPDIWTTSVYAVPWFNTPNPGPLTHKSSNSTSSNSSTSSSSTLRVRGIWDDDIKDDEECAPMQVRCPSIPTAPWARSFQSRSRRGRDRPFATRSQVIAANPGAPAPPPKAHPLPIASRYLELSRPFPSEMDDDKSIQLPSTLSQWVRADLVEGKTVHTRPPITPR